MAEKFKTPNGSDWPMNYRDHTQEQMNYAWRSPGSYMPAHLEKGLRSQAQRKPELLLDPWEKPPS